MSDVHVPKKQYMLYVNTFQAAPCKTKTEANLAILWKIVDSSIR